MLKLTRNPLLLRHWQLKTRNHTNKRLFPSRIQLALLTFLFSNKIFCPNKLQFLTSLYTDTVKKLSILNKGHSQSKSSIVKLLLVAQTCSKMSPVKDESSNIAGQLHWTKGLPFVLAWSRVSLGLLLLIPCQTMHEKSFSVSHYLSSPFYADMFSLCNTLVKGFIYYFLCYRSRGIYCIW